MDVTKYKKEELVSVSENLTQEDIKELVNNLLDKDDKVRYPSFLILKYRFQIKDDLYPYWNNFVELLKSDNSYFRTIGLTLIAINTKWDKDKKIEKIIDEYLLHCNDEKLTTSRLAIQGLKDILETTNYSREICNKIVNTLLLIALSKRPNSNLKVMTTDIVNIFIDIYKEIDYKEINIYLNKCLSENIIDKALKNEIKELLN